VTLGNDDDTPTYRDVFSVGGGPRVPVSIEEASDRIRQISRLEKRMKLVELMIGFLGAFLLGLIVGAWLVVRAVR
jgi:hypothetical protein